MNLFREKKREEWEIDNRVEEEKQEIRDIYLKKGFKEELLHEIVRIITSRRKFLIEHELGRRIAKMLAQSLLAWDRGIDSREPVARFLNAYSVIISTHTGKENIFFDLIEERGSLSEEEHSLLMKHYKLCHSDAGGKARVEKMTKLIGYIEERDCMRE
jgi:hemerythrin-like domain-containing protein